MDEVAKLAMEGKLPVYIKGGYNFVDVDDAVEGIILILEKGKHGENYILSGRAKTIKEYLDIVTESSLKKPI